MLRINQLEQSGIRSLRELALARRGRPTGSRRWIAKSQRCARQSRADGLFFCAGAGIIRWRAFANRH